MRNNDNYMNIPQEKFQFVKQDERIHDKKLETKARSFFADALLRFRKNKSSVYATVILIALLLYAFLVPVLSPYGIDDTDNIYTNSPAYIPSIAKLNLGIWDGARTQAGQNDVSMNFWKGIALETGYDPVIKITDTTVDMIKYRGEMVERTVYTIKSNRYYETGVIYRTLTVDQFNDIQKWQNETGIQVIYPYVESKDICDITDNANIWYKVDSKGAAQLDADGNFIPVYSTRSEVEGAPYDSIRIAGDDGSYIYSFAKGSAVHVRICYYNYYQYLNGLEPTYVLGTDASGHDLFSAIGIGARFSIFFAIFVSAINLSIGAVYGAVQGYYGGKVDLAMDRVSDILSGIPFMVVTTLFQLHLAEKVGPIPSFLFAFVLTGWIGMASLTRKQFYRYKGQEFVMAARTLGASDWRLMFKHIFPNAIGTIITSCALVIPGVISSETSMTYLGIVDLESYAGTTLGTLLSTGQKSMTGAPHAMLWPSVYMALLMICFNLFGNGLRDAFNPSTRGVED